MVRITAFDDNGVYKIDFEIPELDECPICHHALKPTVLNSRYAMDSADKATTLCNLYTMFFCQKCRKVFLLHYLLMQLSAQLFHQYSLTHQTF